MNALIALLHFCEVHGPCVVFCTQTMHNADTHAIDNSAATNDIPASKITMSDTINIPTNDADRHQWNAPTALPDSLSSTSTTDPPTPPNTTTGSPRVSSPSLRKSKNNSIQQQRSCRPSQATSCAACSAQMPSVISSKDGVSAEAKLIVIKDDEDRSVEYVGSKSPQQLHLYKAVRLSCVRSLTTEFCPGREGPVLFGDDQNGYVMSYLFKIRDVQARGEARFYAIMILMTDRVFLVSCWPFLVSSFRSMAINLQEKADAVFQREKETRERIHPFSNRRVAPMSQEQFFRRRSNSAALRSLVDLLGTKDIYLQIHAQFSYILKVSSRRRMEKITPGRSASAAYLKMRDEYHRQNNICQQDQQREQEKGSTIVAHHPPVSNTSALNCTKSAS
ncbi:vesicle coat protein [Dichotomocladium elegans]|nr:vesicle coat protein [Dichotomocladium elegans]